MMMPVRTLEGEDGDDLSSVHVLLAAEQHAPVGLGQQPQEGRGRLEHSVNGLQEPVPHRLQLTTPAHE